MSGYRQLLYHIIIHTKYNRRTISLANSEHLYVYIAGIIKNKNSRLFRINGVENHIHILTDIHPSIALADMVREIKSKSSMWMKRCGLFPDFKGWSVSYGVFTCSYKDMNRIIEYIKNQRVHHSPGP